MKPKTSIPYSRSKPLLFHPPTTSPHSPQLHKISGHLMTCEIKTGEKSEDKKYKSYNEKCSGKNMNRNVEDNDQLKTSK